MRPRSPKSEGLNWAKPKNQQKAASRRPKLRQASVPPPAITARPIQNPKSKIQNPTAPQSGERLQKVLAHAGVASRRAAEEMIAAGRVSVNGEVVREMGVRVLPTDVIQVDGKRLDTPGPDSPTQEHVYIAINKPLGVVSTSKDEHGRPTVLDVLRGQPGGADEGRRTKDEGRKTDASRLTPHASRPQIQNPKSKIQNQRVYPVGRLDADSTGLLLLTNDGDLTFRVTHPRYGLEKEYKALVRGRPGEEAIRRLREGVDIEGGLTAPAKVEHLNTIGGNTWLRITVHEGRKRQVRLMAAAVGHPVIELQRTRVGPIVLGALEPGRWRHLALHEVHALRKAVGLHASTHPRSRR